MQELTHFIGGKHVKGSSGRTAEVFNPATGEVEKRVPLASAAELDAAVANAKEAQPAWAAVNPQRRARVLMKFVDLLHRDMDKLAEALSREHGKTLPDAKGDIQRGVEVVEFACGIPHLMKGEYTDGAGPGSAGHGAFRAAARVAVVDRRTGLHAGSRICCRGSQRHRGIPQAAGFLSARGERGIGGGASFPSSAG